VRANLPIVTEEQARAFYNANKARLNGDFSRLKATITGYLLEQEQQKLLSAYAEQLRKQSAVQIYLTEPKPPNLRQLCCNLVG
jgi:pyridoxal/pyridoxine/pyridoxamine kinase